MGILKQKEVTATAVDAENLKSKAAKRASIQADIANLKPLKPGGALNFTGIRDGNSPSQRKDKDGDDMDSDEDVTTKVNDRTNDIDEEVKMSSLSPEDARKQGEIADGVEKIQVSIIYTQWHYRQKTDQHSSNRENARILWIPSQMRMILLDYCPVHFQAR